MYRRKGQGNVLLSVSVSSTSIVQEAGFHTEWEGGRGGGGWNSPPPSHNFSLPEILILSMVIDVLSQVLNLSQVASEAI